VKTLTPGEVAEAAGVSVSSVKRWVDRGFIKSTRTPGGHRRILVHDALRFFRERHMPIVRPAALKLEDNHWGYALSSVERSGTDLFDHLVAGRMQEAKESILSTFASGASVPAIWDGPVSYALRQIGRLWSERDDGVFIEHRATAICIEAILSVGELLPRPAFSAPVAVGCGPEHDPYIIPNLMAATVLRELGYDAINLGPNTPVTSLETAIRVHSPELVWIALNGRLGRVETDTLAELFGMLVDVDVSVVIGGRSAARLESIPEHVNHLRSMTELRTFTRSLRTEATA
jgi:excisionase family DNA binding protein